MKEIIIGMVICLLSSSLLAGQAIDREESCEDMLEHLIFLSEEGGKLDAALELRGGLESAGFGHLLSPMKNVVIDGKMLTPPEILVRIQGKSGDLRSDIIHDCLK